MKKLLQLARAALESRLRGKEVPISEDIKKKYSEKGACFVTLTIKGELRGCIGSLEAVRPLYRDVIENSINAGFNDPRFLPLDEKELARVKIEISVLTKPEKLGKGKQVFDKIDNKMGIVLKSKGRSSTFLPQVWEQIPDKKYFLEHLSAKAGLFKEDWKEAELWFYRAESFEES